MAAKEPMSKPPSGLFSGTKGEIALRGDAESVIASRTGGLDLREHPTTQKQLSAKARRSIAQKIRHRTATREECERYMWDKRFGKLKWLEKLDTASQLLPKALA